MGRRENATEGRVGSRRWGGGREYQTDKDPTEGFQEYRVLVTG
jgi:hypothetical protein